jgi:DnaK suppressor protein
MNPENQKKFTSIIEDHIKEIERALEERRDDTAPISPDVSVGRLSRLDAMQMQQMALESDRRNREQLQRLQDALIKVERDTYGTCMKCNKDIAEERLRAQPDAFLCIDCAS